MTNQQLVDHGNHMMDETDQAIDRAKKVCKFECISRFLCYVGWFMTSAARAMQL